ncbi:tetratricopeptide repeat protein [bacterium]|nr:tetratricopeptide repeat protein [bacterium]MBP9807727.1 tetratricopeptide repeat protein [bacterium]
MRCPNCGTYHPSQYQNCVSCGQEFYVEEEIAETAPLSDSASAEAGKRAVSHSNSQSGKNYADPDYIPPASEPFAQVRYDVSRKDAGDDLFDDSGDGPSSSGKSTAKAGAKTGSKRRSSNMSLSLKSGMPLTAGLLFGLTTVLIFAGATIFFLTKAPEEDRLLGKGLKELDNGQYAFAVETLTKASNSAKDNPKIMLALARAYVGVDQIDKAKDCIAKAQELGKGIIEDPDLASQLANYYRVHSRYDKACELLRPLAQANIPGKKAELADLDALWGDQELRDGHLEKALSLWEEVKDLKEGSRFSESDARLSTIYQRLAAKLVSDKKDKEALVYLGKLNAIADNSRNYEMAADIYERTGQYELAIDQLRKAQRFSTRDDSIKRKLAALLNKRGKELLDSGDLDTGYGYLQQAKSVDPSNTVPTVTLKTVTIDLQGGMPHIAGQVWNPTDSAINALTMKVDLVDTKAGDKILWTKESAVVDEFVPPLPAREGKKIDLTGGASVRNDGSCEFKVYFDGKLYNSYPIGKKERSEKIDLAKNKSDSSSLPALAPANSGNSTSSSASSSTSASGSSSGSSSGSGQAQTQEEPPLAPAIKSPSAEEKTMKELE